MPLDVVLELADTSSHLTLKLYENIGDGYITYSSLTPLDQSLYIRCRQDPLLWLFLHSFSMYPLLDVSILEAAA
jgi:hypothetical protein